MVTHGGASTVLRTDNFLRDIYADFTLHRADSPAGKTAGDTVVFAALTLMGLFVGYAAQIIVERFTDARQVALANGEDTSTDKDVTLTASHHLPWSRPNLWTLILGAASTAILLFFYRSFDELSVWGVLLVVGSVPFLILLAVTDAVAYRLPFPMSFGLLGWQLVCLTGVGLTTGRWVAFIYAAVGAVVFAGFLLFIFVASAGNLGFGDVVLGVPLGVLLGATGGGILPAVSGALYGLLLGSILMGLVFLGIAAQRALRGKQGGMGEGEGGPPRRYVPFGPNLIAGAWIILLLAA
jgi:hypothetical protein